MPDVYDDPIVDAYDDPIVDHPITKSFRDRVIEEKNPLNRLAIWSEEYAKRYPKGVEDAFKGTLPQIPRVEGGEIPKPLGSALASIVSGGVLSGMDARPALAAGVNTAAGLVNSASSPGAVAAVVSPASAIAATPYMLGEAKKQAGVALDSNAPIQERIEAGIAAPLSVLGAVAPVAHTAAKLAPAPKSPSLVTQVDSATGSSKGNALTANVEANKIALTPRQLRDFEPVEPKPSATQGVENQIQPKELAQMEKELGTPLSKEAVVANEALEPQMPIDSGEVLPPATQATEGVGGVVTPKDLATMESELGASLAPEVEAANVPAQATGDLATDPLLAKAARSSAEAMLAAEQQAAEVKRAANAQKDINSTLGVTDEAGYPAEDTRLADQLKGENTTAMGEPKGTEAPTLESLVGQKVDYQGESGTLIRNDDGSFGVMPDVRPAGQPIRILDIEGADKTGTIPQLADDLGVRPTAPKIEPEVKVEIPDHPAVAELKAISNLSIPSYNEFLKSLPEGVGITETAERIGQAVKDSPQSIEALKQLYERSIADAELAKSKYASDRSDNALHQAYVDTSMRTQLFSEAYQKATETGGFAPELEQSPPTPKTPAQDAARRRVEAATETKPLENALQEPSPESVPVPSQASPSQEVGSQVRSGEQVPTEARQSEVAQPADNPTPPPVPAVVERGDASVIVRDNPRQASLAQDNPNIYEPFLTGLAESDNKFVRGLGHVAEVLRKVLPVTDNIRAISPRVAGQFRDFLMRQSDRTVDWTDRSMPDFAIARKTLGKDFEQWSQLLLDGKLNEALQLASKHEGGESIMGRIDENWGAVRDEILADHNRTRPGEEIEGLNQYFPRIVSDRKGLMKALEQEDPGPIKAALEAATADKGSPLTAAEESAVASKLIYDSAWLNRGKPGYLKQRTLDQLGTKYAKFFEPVDVAIEKYIGKSARDISTREFFGKVDPEAKSPWLEATQLDDSPIGRTLAEEVEDGNIKPDGQSKIVESLNDYFHGDQDASPNAYRFNRLVGMAATAGYLADISTAVTQAGDAFLSAVRSGPKAAFKNYGKALQNTASRVPGLKGIKPENFLTLDDLGLHEGNIETADFARGSGWSSRTIGKVVKATIGIMDAVGKEATANAIAERTSEAVRDPNSKVRAIGEANFPKLNERYSEMFPEDWGKMLESLGSEDFKNRKLDANSRKFLFNALSDIQPVTRGELAQGMVGAHPWLRSAWKLTSYMTRQLGYMKRNVYDEARKGNHLEAASWFAAYVTFLSLGNTAVQYIKDQLQGRQSSPGEYAFGAVAQTLGVNRYALSQIGKGNIAEMVGERLIPGVGIAKDAISDLSLGRDYLTGRRYENGEKVVKGIPDLLKQAEAVKYIPFLGREIYGRYGKGATKEQQRQQKLQNGSYTPSSLQTIEDLVAPGPKSGKHP